MAVAWLAVTAGLSAASSIAGGVSNSMSAGAQNRRAEQNAEYQRQEAENAALVQNSYNKLVTEAERINYERQREYQWQTAVQNWQYQTQIKDFEYLQSAREYLGSVENTQQQLTYNTVAAQQAQEQEQASIAEILNEAAFQQEGMIIEQLQNEGRAAMMQAGGSRAKAIQSTVAEQGRNAAILSASLLSAGQQSQRNMRDIALSRYADDLKARNAMMIEPERLPDIPKPIKAPDRVFVEPMMATPAYIPAPLRQNTFAPVIQGVGQAFGTAANTIAMGLDS